MLMLKRWDDGRSMKNNSDQGHKVLDYNCIPVLQSAAETFRSPTV